MAFEIMDTIRLAEKKADEMRLDAQAQGREIVKACEEACLLEEKTKAQEMRTRYTEKMDEKRKQLEKMIASKAEEQQKQLDTALEQAEALLPKAARVIAERVRDHGDR